VAHVHPYTTDSEAEEEELLEKWWTRKRQRKTRNCVTIKA